MRISDLIRRLVEEQDAHGDLYIEDQSGVEVLGIHVVTENGTPVAVCVQEGPDND